ncbi:MAG: hypothetical protein HC814_04835 [Rhodobacteraceae bacterium]|nr:hypothetical protein [Paracoccaceae bacterium]
MAITKKPNNLIPHPMTEPSNHTPTSEPEETVDDETLRRELMEELDRLIARVRESVPDYTPPPYSPKRLIGFLQENLQRFAPNTQQSILERLRDAIGQDFLDVDTWKGMWFMLNYTLEYRGDQFKRRFTGEYQTDHWGMDYEFIEVVQPLFDFLQSSIFALSFLVWNISPTTDVPFSSPTTPANSLGMA